MRLPLALTAAACLAVLSSAGPAQASPSFAGAGVHCVTDALLPTCGPAIAPVPAPPLPAPPAAAPSTPAPSTPSVSAPSADDSLPCPGQDQAPTASTLAVARGATRCLINRERQAHGLDGVRAVGTLTSAATAYAGRMAQEDFFDHVAPDGSTLLARLNRTDYLGGSVRSWSIGENLAWGTGRLATPEAVVASWVQSPLHRHNLLDPRFTELGLGVALGAPKSGVSDGRAATYVNDFGTRRR